MISNVLALTDPRADLPTVGGKGASLARLARAGFPVPDGFHVSTSAYRRFVAEGGLAARIESSLVACDPAQPERLEEAARAIREAFTAVPIPPDLAREIGNAYEELARGAATPEERAVAVRSSATVEDLPELSFAGQQESFLDVRGTEAVLQAVRTCWASLWTGRAVAYRMRTGVGNGDIALAVVVQLLVDADASGVMFTADPATGRRDRTIIDAAWGLGEAVVGGRVTPDVVVLAKDTAAVIERTTSDKTLRTVRRGGHTAEEPVPEALRRAPVLDDRAASELAAMGTRVEALYGAPTDIEWARSGGRFHLLQARPITALKEEEPAPPAAWDPPFPRTRWSRGSVADFMPDPLSPLFASLGLRVYGEAFNRTVQEMTGVRDLYGSAYAVTINGYAYITMNITPRMIGSILFRLVPKVIPMMRHARRVWERERDRYRAVVAEVEERDPLTMGATELLAEARRAWQAAAQHLTVFQFSGVLAAMTEMILSRLWERDKRRRRAPTDPPASALLLGYESEPIRADYSLWDLTESARRSDGLGSWLAGASAAAASAALTRGEKPDAVPEADWLDFRAAFLAHLDTYGRAIHALDFVSPTPAEAPEVYLATMKYWLAGHGTNPKDRQAKSAARREALAAAVRARARGPRGWLLKKVLAWGQSAAPLREDSIAALGHGTPVVRRFVIELGSRLTAAGSLAAPADVFWLDEAELDADARSLDAGLAVPERLRDVARRKALWRSRKRVIPPSTVPRTDKFMGFKVADFVRDGADRKLGLLDGIAASGGTVTAPARVLHGPEDFARMHAGEVLVAEITTPAWTPLFALAAAVVTDTGGPLSHGSIVAREYGIPAVLGTGSATRRVKDGDLVTVDGDAGRVTWEEAELAPTPPGAPAPSGA